MRRWPLRLGLQLGLFQLGIGLFGVLSLGLFNRLLIEEMQLPAVLAAVAIGSQQLMGFMRVWFGNRSDRIPLSQLRRTPFIVGSSLALALLFALACQLLLQSAKQRLSRVVRHEPVLRMAGGGGQFSAAFLSA